jgi:hypothetical protein
MNHGLAFTIGVCIGTLLFWLWTRRLIRKYHELWPKTKPAPQHIPLDSICPACGHAGCKLQFVPPGKIEVGEKREVRATPPMVERKCNTCGALAYEKTVLEPEKWVKA